MESYEFYKKTDSDKMILRDYLAFDRTVLANYRTVLSFYRTALASFGAGLTLIKLFEESQVLKIIGAIAIGAAALCVIIGGFSYLTTKKRLQNVYKKDPKQKA